MRSLSRWVAAALVVAVTAVAPTPARVSAASVSSPSVAPAATSRVTLVTGDVVELSQAAPGRYAASVHPGPGREKISFHTSEVDGGLRVLPSDAIPYVSSGVLDVDLFDVTGLIDQGYDDRSSDTLPLIVRGSPERALGRVGAAQATRGLPSIGGSALAAGKDGLGDLWRSVTGSKVGVMAAGISEIWLDRRVHAALDRSVPQIGAPQAWAAGYDGTGVDVAVLDTGVDATHADLSGKVAEAENFTDSADTVDRVGHGTHVAATIAGTGAASDGSRRGVAPGADLLVGKVLNDEGIGYESWVIAGMEWAVQSGAKVVSMSLGGDPTDGTDPLSEAVDRLTDESGALFVVAAGNDGPTEGSIGAPGSASAALTVGAVDRDENLADFSGRGPRQGDYALKPEITAPGVGIVAARAAGTAMGDPVDDAYTAASGTSMATPHVAGSAALLVQQHPDWDAARLKDALVSTAKPNPELTVFEQGGGRVDVARAVRQRVYGSGVADFGMHAQSSGPAPVEKAVRYANDTASPVTLELTVQLSNLDSGATSSGALALGAQQVTVPAGSTVDVPVTLDPTKLTRGRHGGWITASGPDGVTVRTAVATTLEGPHHTVTFRGVDRRGEDTTVPAFVLNGDSSRSDVLSYVPSGDGLTLDLEEGTYLLQAVIEDGGPLDEQATLVTNPELDITGDATIVLDARKGTPVRILTPRPAEQQTVFSYYVHRVMGNGRSVSHGVLQFSSVHQLNVTPTKPVTRGEYEFSSRWQLVAPMVSATVSGVYGPLDVHLLHRSPAFEGRREFRLAYAGAGTEKELSAAQVRGAAALMVGSYERDEEEQIAAAAAAGAAVAIIVRPEDFSPWTVWRPVGDREPVPAMVVAYDDGQRLIAAAKAGRTQIGLTLTISSPYLYDVFQVERGRVPDRIEYRVTKANTAQLTAEYGENGGFGWAKEQRFGWRPWQEYAWNDTQRMVATPSVREEWVTAGDTLWQQSVQHLYTWDDLGPLQGGMTEAPRQYQAGPAADEAWFTPVVRPAAVPGIVSTRVGNLLSFRIPEFVDATPGHYGRAGWGGEDDQISARLLRDGTVLAELPDAWQDVQTNAGSAAYRLELTTHRESEEWQFATRTETAWEFKSSNVGETRPLPLLQVDYHVSGHSLGLTLRHQQGLPTPRGTSVRVEVSYDDGLKWTAARVSGHDTGYSVAIPAGKGAVSLRVHATASDGSAVTQTVIRAF
jgi:subtilisin family serine protease